MQPDTGHGFLFFPPLRVMQCSKPCTAGVVHPSSLHHPYAPCLWQRPRACARVLQASMLHAFVRPPPCLPHSLLLLEQQSCNCKAQADRTKPTLSFVRVGFASPGCADPERTVFGANAFVRDSKGVALWSSAKANAPAVLPAKEPSFSALDAVQMRNLV